MQLGKKLHKKQLNIATQLFVFLLISNTEQAICHTLINGSEVKSSLLESKTQFCSVVKNFLCQNFYTFLDFGCLPKT